MSPWKVSNLVNDWKRVQNEISQPSDETTLIVTMINILIERLQSQQSNGTNKKITLENFANDANLLPNAHTFFDRILKKLKHVIRL